MGSPLPSDWGTGAKSAVESVSPGSEPNQVSTRADTALGETPAENREAQRHDSEVSGRLRLPASEHDCKILDLSTLGMRLAAPCALVSVGEQVVVETQNFPLLLGNVVWRREREFGVQFVHPIAEAIVERVVRSTRRVRAPRAGRVAVKLPALVFFEDQRIDVLVCNISLGGLMMTARRPVMRGCRNPIRRGQALMIEFPEMWPLGGHVRWRCGAQAGIMFSRLLKPETAADVARMANLSPLFLDEVRCVHDWLCSS